MLQTPEKLPILLLSARTSLLPQLRATLNHHSITEQQWRILDTLKKHPGCCSFELAQLTCILSPSLSNLIAKLENQGLVSRWQNDSDQRSKHIALTSKGENLYDTIFSSLETRYYRQLNECLDESDMSTLISLLHKIIDNQQAPSVAQ